MMDNQQTSTSSPSNQSSPTSLVSASTTNKRAREDESIDSDVTQQQQEEETITNARKRRRLDDITANNNQDNMSDDENRSVLPSSITESIIKVYASNQLEDAQQYISNIKVINVTQSGDLIAQLEINHQLYTVTIHFSGDFVSKIACQVPECSKICSFWCDHATSVLLRSIRTPEIVLNEHSMEEFLVTAQRENLLASAVLKFLQKHPSYYEELVQNVNSIRLNPELVNIGTTTKQSQNSTSCTDKSTTPSHFINFDIIRKTIDSQLLEFVEGYTDTERCDDYECECHCHGRNKHWRNRYDYDPESSDEEEECDRCDKTTTYYEFPDNILTEYLARAETIMNESSSDIRNALKIIEIIGSSLIGIEFENNFGSDKIHYIRQVFTIFKEIKDKTQSAALAYKNGQQLLSEEDRTYMIQILTTWNAALQALANKEKIDFETADLSSAIAAMSNGWTDSKLLKVLSGDAEAMESFYEQKEIQDIRISSLLDDNRILEACYYCQAVDEYLLSCICYLAVDEFDRAIELAKKLELVYERVSFFALCIAFINMKHFNTSQETINTKIISQIKDHRTVMSGEMVDIVNSFAGYLISLTNLRDAKLKQYSNTLFDTIVIALNNADEPVGIDIAIAPNICESINGETNKIECSAHTLMLLLLFFAFDYRLGEIQKIILDNLNKYSRSAYYYICRIFFDVFKKPTFVYTVVQHALKRNETPRYDFCLWLSKVMYQIQAPETSAEPLSKLIFDELKVKLSKKLGEVDILVQCATNLNDVNEQFDTLMHALRSSIQIAVQNKEAIPLNVFIQTTEIACISDGNTRSGIDKLRTEWLDTMIKAVQETMNLDDPLVITYTQSPISVSSSCKTFGVGVLRMLSMGYHLNAFELLKFTIKLLGAVATSSSTEMQSVTQLLTKYEPQLFEIAYELDTAVRTETDTLNPPYFDEAVQIIQSKSKNDIKSVELMINTYKKYHMHERIAQLDSFLPETTPTNRNQIQSIMLTILEAAKSWSQMTNNQSEDRKQRCIQLTKEIFQKNPTIANFNRIEDLAIQYNERDHRFIDSVAQLLQYMLEKYNIHQMPIIIPLPDIYKVTTELLIRFSYLKKAEEILAFQIGQNMNSETICCALFEYTFTMLAKYRVPETNIHTWFQRVFIHYGTHIISTKWQIRMELPAQSSNLSLPERQIFMKIDSFWLRSHSSFQFENAIVLKFALPLCSDFYLWFQKQKIVKLQQMKYASTVYSPIVTLLAKIKKSMELFGNARVEWTNYIEDFKRVNKAKKSLINLVNHSVDLNSTYTIKNKTNFARDIQNIYCTPGTRAGDNILTPTTPPVVTFPVASTSGTTQPTRRVSQATINRRSRPPGPTVNIYDPITKTVMENPVKSTTCGHTFEKVHILELIKRQGGYSDCPIAGCNKQIRGTDLTADIEMKRMIQEEIQRQAQQQQKAVEVIALDDDSDDEL
jgi:hypothetical protein